MKEIFANPDIGLIGLLFFFIFFCAVTIWTFRPNAKKSYEDNANIPLNDGDGDNK
jgi:cbb3-type cytochrome oxidase subunit 3